MKRKKGWIAIIAVIAVIVLLFAGYNIYRYPAMFRSLSDNSLNDSQESYDLTNKLIEVEILDGVHPEINVSVDSIDEYDTIFVGYPIWWDEAPAMIATFLADNDFSGKTIIPFCTSSSDDIGNSLHIFSELCPDAKIAEGLTANDPNDIEPWIQGLGIRK